jgi:hypothetical protein
MSPPVLISICLHLELQKDQSTSQLSGELAAPSDQAVNLEQILMRKTGLMQEIQEKN